MELKWGVASPLAPLIISSFLLGSFNLVESGLGISKREAALINIIEDNALTLDAEKFHYDPIMVQAKAYSLYTDPNKLQGKNLIFRKKSPDSDKEAIALSSIENEFAIPTARGGKKRQFVLLRKSPSVGGSTEGTPYFGSFVFVRAFLPNDSSTNVFEINGIKNVVEWDIWETRPAPGFYPGWGTCEFTTLFTCETLQDMLDKANKEADADKDKNKPAGRKVRRKRQSEGNSEPKSLPALTPIQTEPGFDPNEYNDLYLDLDFHRVEEGGPMGRRLVAMRNPSQKRSKRSLDEPESGWVHRRVKRFGFARKMSGATPAKDNKQKAKKPEERHEDHPAEDKPAAQQGRGLRANANADVNVNADAKASGGGSGGIGGLLGGITGGGLLPFNKFNRGTNILKQLHTTATGALGGVTGGAGGLGGLVGGLTSTLDFDGDPLKALGGVSGLTNILSIAKPDALTEALSGNLVSSLTAGLNVDSLLGGALPIPELPLDLGLKGLAAIGGVGLDGTGKGGSGPLAALTGVTNSISGVTNLAGGLGGLTGALGGLTGGLGGLGGVGGLGALSSRLEELGSFTKALDGLGLGLQSLDSVGGLGAVVGGLNSLVGGNIGDVGVDGVASVLAGINVGSLGPLNIVTDLVTGGLGGAGAIKSLLGPAGGVFEIVNQQVKGLASSLSGDNLISSLTGAGGLDMSASVGGIVSTVLGGSKDLNPLAMTQKILGPIAASLDPVNAIITASNSIAGGLPGLGSSMGHGITGGLPSVLESLSVEGLLGTVGLGPVQELVPGLADTVKGLGEGILSPHDIIGKGVIEAATSSLVKIGLPLEVAKLSAIGSQLAFVENAIQLKGIGLGVRQISALAGVSLNGGNFRGSGAGPATGSFKSWQKMMNIDGAPSNALTIFGVAYPGAGESKDFFFPEGALVRAKFKVQSANPASVKGVSGFYEPGANTGHSDMFHPDNPSEVESLIGLRGTITPDQYKQPHRDANNGVVGVIQANSHFMPDAKAKPSVYHFSSVSNASAYWIPPNAEKKAVNRPEQTPDKKPLIYGYLFQGVRDSPHIFISEGDSLSGFFVPHDDARPEYKETPHGVFLPDHPAGHASFVLDDGTDLFNVKELRGAFLPDAMNLAGGISGRLSRTGESDNFNFVMDEPAVDFVYIKNHTGMTNIWAAFLSKEEWKQNTPPVPPAKAEPKKEKAPTGRAGLGVFGTRVVTQKTECFLPENFGIDGLIMPVEKGVKYTNLKGTLYAGAPNANWRLEIKTADTSEITKTVVALFVPNGYPAEDALIGTFTLNADKTSAQIKIIEKQRQSEHFWNSDEEIWLPAGFAGKVAESSSTKSGEIPGSASHDAATVPDKPPNYFFGPEYEASPEMEENVLKDLPRELNYGQYLQDETSPEPVFVPDGGASAVFTPTSGAGGKPQRGFLFAGKGNGQATFVAETAGSVKVGTEGIISVVTKKKDSAKGFIKATFTASETLDIGKGTEFIRGWKHAVTQGTSQMAASLKATVNADTLKLIKKPLSYNLVSLGGGFKGVIVDGAAALEDANNPLFQEFLHFKAHRDGNVNPWGNVLVVDPVSRDAGASADAGAGLNLGVDGLVSGGLQNVIGLAPNISKQLLGTFSLANWEWPILKTVMNTKAGITSKLKLGTKTNVVSMLDFRMFLAKKYSCKKAQVEDGKWVKILAPLAAEPFLNILEASAPKKEFLDTLVTQKVNLAVPETEGIVGLLSSQFQINALDLEAISGVLNVGAGLGGLGGVTGALGGLGGVTGALGGVTGALGGVTGSLKGATGALGGLGGLDAITRLADLKNTVGSATSLLPGWANAAPIGVWGDDSSCDKIELDDLAAAQAVTKHTSTGMDLGLQLVTELGSVIKFGDVASKLLTSVDNKAKKEPPGAVLQDLGATDMTGNVGRALKGSFTERKQASVDTNSEEAGGSANAAATTKGGRKGRRKRREAEDDKGKVKNIPGWKTQFKPEKFTDNVTILDDGMIFYGLGNCERKGKPSLSLFESKDPSQVIEYYLAVLRIDCMLKAKKRVMDLFNEKFLSFGDDKNYFEVPTTNPLFNMERITPYELRKLSVAFELSAFSKTYHMLRKKGYPTTGYLTEPNCKISRSMGLMTELALYYITKARRVSPSHSVRLTRNLLKTLRTTLTKLHQDSMALDKKCPDPGCALDKMLTEGDKFRVVSLVQFIIHGMGPFEKGDKPLREYFYKFVGLNKEAIKERVAEFSRQYPKNAEKH